MQKLLYGVVFGFDLFFSTQEVVFDCFIMGQYSQYRRGAAAETDAARAT